MGRLAPWLQGGLRVPLTLTMDRLDGETATAMGMGSGLAWIDVETPEDWPSPRAPRATLEVGVGRQGLGTTSPGARMVQGAVRASGGSERWGVSGDLVGRAPIRVEVTGPTGEGPVSKGTTEGDLSLVVDRQVGHKARVGAGVGVFAASGTVPSFSASLGPNLVIAPTNADRLVFAARAGAPIEGLGQNAPSRLQVSFDWYHVLVHGDG